MKSTGFTKRIPVTEAEYHKFREVQNKQAKLMREELDKLSALTLLAKHKMRKHIHYSNNRTTPIYKSNAICIW